jgi:hypothetical protein
MLFYFVLLAASRILHCGHHQFQHKLNVTVAKGTHRLLDSAWSDPAQGSPIRVHFDTSYVETLDSSVSCISAGSTVTWDSYSYTCTAADVFTADQKAALLATLSNVATYASTLLKVVPVETLISDPQFQILAMTSYPVSQQKAPRNTDFYVTVYPRPFGEGDLTLASAGYVQRATWAFGRPVQGLMNVNMAAVPSSAQTVSTTGDRQFFETLLHELFHALGISGSAFQYWLNPTTHAAYGTTLPFYTYTDTTGKTFNILHTPHIHETVVARSGATFFFNAEHPSGVEIEDGGGTGTAGSHWESRAYYTEIMGGVAFGYASISAITLAALRDTGWYGVSMDLAEPLPWGDYRSVRGATAASFTNFLTSPPAEVWPAHYIARSANETATVYCSFDLRATAGISKQQRNCGTRTDGECKFPEFYDSRNTGLYTHVAFDYALIPEPIDLCADPTTAGTSITERGAARGPGTFCAATSMYANGYYYTTHRRDCFPMACDAEGLKVTVGNVPVVCGRAGELKTVPGFGGTLMCPDPDIACGIITYFYPTLEPTQTPTATPTPSPTPIALTVAGDTTVESSDHQTVCSGNGTISPAASASEIVMRDFAVTGNSNITAVGLVITTALEVRAPAVLAAAVGNHIAFGAQAHVRLLVTGGGWPLLRVGEATANSGGRALLADGEASDSTGPKAVTIDLNAALFPNYTNVSQAVVTAVGSKCNEWKDKTSVTDAEHFEVDCRMSSNDGPDLFVVGKPTPTPKPPDGKNTVLLGLTKEQLIYIAVGIVVTILVSVIITYFYRKRKGRGGSYSPESELSHGQYRDQI